MIKLNIIKTYFFSVDDLKRFSTNKPLLFRGVKYDYWKEQMIAHLNQFILTYGTWWKIEITFHMTIS